MSEDWPSAEDARTVVATCKYELDSLLDKSVVDGHVAEEEIEEAVGHLEEAINDLDNAIQNNEN